MDYWNWFFLFLIEIILLWTLSWCQGSDYVWLIFSGFSLFCGQKNFYIIGFWSDWLPTCENLYEISGESFKLWEIEGDIPYHIFWKCCFGVWIERKSSTLIDTRSSYLLCGENSTIFLWVFEFAQNGIS